MRRLLFPVLAFLALFVIPVMTPAWAQDQDPLQGLPPRAAPTAHVQVQQLAVVDATPNFDAARATTAYLAQVSGAARAKSDAYFEGGYWLMAADLLWTTAVIPVGRPNRVLPTHLARLNREDAIACYFCSVKKTLAMGIPLAILIFGSRPDLSLILLPIMFYHPFQLFTNGILANHWAKQRGMG